MCVFAFGATDVVVDVIGSFGPAEPDDDVDVPAPEVDADGCPAGVPRWSAGASWPDGSAPAQGAAPVIPAGVTIALDTDPPPLSGLTVDGTLVACERDLALAADWVVVHGELRAGWADRQFTPRLTITLTGAPGGDVMGMGTRGLFVMGGGLQLHGASPGTVVTKLTAHAAAGADQLRLASTAGWRVGDEIAVAPTDFYGAGSTERFTISSVSATTVGLDAPLVTGRWGRMQYVTASGMSLTPPAVPLAVPQEPTPTQLDERAEVVNLTRNIVVQGADDTAWSAQRFGAQTMVMGLDSQVTIDGVELRRVGQLARQGAYPVHWHRLSYGPSGDLLGDAAGQSIRNSAIVDSANRCIVLHATNGVTVHRNACVGITGHAVFLEDAVERRNTITDNVVLAVRNPPVGQHLLQHEIAVTGESGSSGFWVANPDNVVSGNVAADTETFGFWLAFPDQPWGTSTNVAIQPRFLRFGEFDDNVTHSNRVDGVRFDDAQIAADGTTAPMQYYSTADGRLPTSPYSTLERFHVRRLSTWKNGGRGIWVRATWLTESEIVSADNQLKFFERCCADGRITRSLVVGTSLNHPTAAPPPTGPPTAFGTYHSDFDIDHNVVVAFPHAPHQQSGVFATDDYYLRPVEKGQIRNHDNLFIASHPGYRVPRPSPNYALAGAIWDPHGIWGPDGNWSVYDQAFFTHHGACVGIAPAATSGARSCDGDYFGFLDFQLSPSQPAYESFMALEVTRYQMPAVVQADTGGFAPVGAPWTVGDGSGLVGALGNMRHFAARDDATSAYRLAFPGSPTPTDVGMRVENMHEFGDSIVLGVEFDVDQFHEVYATTIDNFYAVPGSSPYVRRFTPATSMADLVDDAGDPHEYWLDAANDTVWVKLRGGIPQDYVAPEFGGPTDDFALYDRMQLRIH